MLRAKGVLKRLIRGASRRLVPDSRRYASRHRKVKANFQEYMQRHLGNFFVDVDPGPFGDPEIILRTSMMREEDVATKTTPDYYFQSGYATLLSWMKHLERHSFNLHTVRAIMELGCGSARLIRHWRCIDGIRLVGSDVKPEFIEWCKKGPEKAVVENVIVTPLSSEQFEDFIVILENYPADI
jgi:hypothetical protein